MTWMKCVGVGVLVGVFSLGGCFGEGPQTPTAAPAATFEI
jgi:hypothetical protein